MMTMTSTPSECDLLCPESPHRSDSLYHVNHSFVHEDGATIDKWKNKRKSSKSYHCWIGHRALLGIGLVVAALVLALFATHHCSTIDSQSLSSKLLSNKLRSHTDNESDVDERKQSLRDELYIAFGFAPSDKEDSALAQTATTATSTDDIPLARKIQANTGAVDNVLDNSKNDLARGVSTFKSVEIDSSDTKPVAADTKTANLDNVSQRLTPLTTKQNSANDSKTNDDSDKSGSSNSLRNTLLSAFGLAPSETHASGVLKPST